MWWRGRGLWLLGDFDASIMLSDLDRLVETERFRANLEPLHTCLERGDDERARLHFGNWVATDKSVCTALYCFLLGEDLEDTIRRAIRIGGDTDTIAAMAGALAGARFGIDPVPGPWRGVEGYERMIELADPFADRNTEGTSHESQ